MLANQSLGSAARATESDQRLPAKVRVEDKYQRAYKEETSTEPQYKHSTDPNKASGPYPDEVAAGVDDTHLRRPSV